MLELLIAILIALHGGWACELGDPLRTDWSVWVDEHPEATRLMSAWGGDEFQVAVFDSRESYLVLFVYDMENYPHGECARELERP